MFFIFSKLLGFLTAPALWFTALFVWSYFAKKPSLKKRLWAIAFSGLYIFSNGILYNEVRRIYEPDFVAVEDVEGHYDYAVVLTGMTRFNREKETVQFTASADRIMQAMALYGLGKIDKIFITGGSSKILGDSMREANFLREYLMHIGFPEEDVLVEAEARSTRENAVYTKQYFEDVLNRKSFLLVTSATHMPRSKMCFDKLGMEVSTFCTNPADSREAYSLQALVLPNPAVLDHWRALFHEWIGIFAYWLAGYV